MARTAKKVSHMKAGKAEVKIHFYGKRLELTIVIPREIEKQLTKRLNSKKRWPPKARARKG
jgi:hypothetical protein